MAVINFQKETRICKINQKLRFCSDELFDLLCRTVEQVCNRESQEAEPVVKTISVNALADKGSEL